MLTKIPKGMKDVLPAESARWRAVEKECRQAALLAGYREIRTPVLEHTELFARSAGESSDVVRKEMYTFKDKGDRSVTLKPESTAGTVRAFLESGLYAQALPMKMYYINAPHFRYEAPQSGRLREHHQFGMECFGAFQPSADAELIVLVVELLGKLGLENLSVRINSIGCPNCRPAYQQHFKEYLNARREKLCKSCQERMDINPMRTLDCKEAACKEELKLMLTLTKPKFFIPVHGEARHLYQHKELAEELGIPEEDIFVTEIGDVVELTRNKGRIAGSVTAGSVMVDGSGVGDIGNVVLRDRKLLSEDGIFTVVITLNKQTGALLAQPEILSRGFVYEKNSEELLKETRELVKAKAAQFEKNHRSSWSSIKNDIRNSIKNYLYERTKRRPMVMPIIIEI